MLNVSFEEDFRNYLKASYPLLTIRSHEEGRVIRAIINATAVTTTTQITVYSWDCRRLLEKHSKNADGKAGGTWEKQGGPTAASDFSTTNIIDSIRAISSKGSGRNIFILKDFHPYIEAPQVTRPLRNALEELRGKGTMIVFLGPVLKIPVELEKEIQILDFKMPDGTQLEAILNSVVAIYNQKQKMKGAPEQLITDDVKQSAVEAAKGLTYGEAHDAFSLAIISNHAFNSDFILSVFEEKVKQIKRTGLLQYIKPDIRFENIGGLEGLKKWIRSRSKAYSAAARTYSLPYPKGVLLCGIPGCGKTALAKATANEFGFPLFQLDIGALFGKLVGESEENFRKVIEQVEGIGRCILFIDEIEKSLNRNATSGSGDSGTSSRAFATLLSWLSDHKSPVFVIATSNDHTRLPTEFIRKGRFDELFWLDLPTKAERKAIFDVLLKRYNRDSSKFNLDMLAERSEGYTGAEIEQIIIGAMFTKFDTDGKDITNTNLTDEMNSTKPLSQTSEVEIKDMRNKAINKLRYASTSGVSRMFTGLEGKDSRPDNAEALRELDIS